MAKVDFLDELEKRHDKEWLLVGMSIIRAVAIIQAKLLECLDKYLVNEVTATKITGDSFKKQLRLAYGLGVIEKRHQDALLHLATLRNKWAHEDDIEMELKDMSPVLNMLSQDNKAKIGAHVDNLWGHFRYTCDVACNEMIDFLTNDKS